MTTNPVVSFKCEEKIVEDILEHPNLRKAKVEFDKCIEIPIEKNLDHPNLKKVKAEPFTLTPKETDPCAKEEPDPCKPDPCCPKPDPCKKSDPCCPKPKPDPCCPKPKPDPCCPKPDPCKSDSCKPKTPCKKDPCKKPDPCAEPDPCDKDPCKKPNPCCVNSTDNNSGDCSKKYQKLKVELEKHNYDIGILRKNINKLEAKKTKTESERKRLCCMKTDLKRMKKELERMVKIVVQEQQKSNDGVWGRIPVAANSDDFTANMFGVNEKPVFDPPKLPRNVSNLSCVSGFSNLDLQEKLVSENEFLECDRYKLQEDVQMKDKMIDVFQQRINILECKMREMCKENMDLMQKMKACPSEPSCDTKPKKSDPCEKYGKSNSSNSDKIQSSLTQARCQLEKLKSEKDALENCRKTVSKICDPHYMELLQQYQKKEEECEKLSQRLKCLVNECDSDTTKAENSFLKKRTEELATEIDEFKILNKELSDQLDLYRNKFLKAQERSEEQKLRLEKLEENNRQIENQVNQEICRIQQKFQEKLQELCPYPKKLEEAKSELKCSNKKVEKLEIDLKATIAELCKAKSQLKKLQEMPDENIEKKNQKLQAEIEQLKQKHCSLKNTKDCLEEKLKTMNSELESLRKESVKIISTTKACSDKNRDILHEHIDCLEGELSKTRASAAMALKEKECTIQKMQDQLTELCCKFDDAQSQIRQLKNHITCLSKKKHSICSEDFDRADFCK